MTYFYIYYCFVQKMGDNFGIHRGPAARGTGNATAADDRTQGQILSDFLLQLEDYTPTVNTLTFLLTFFY